MTGTEWGQLALAIAAGQIISDSVETATMMYIRRKDMQRVKEKMDAMARSMAAEAMIELSKAKTEDLP